MPSTRPLAAFSRLVLQRSQPTRALSTTRPLSQADRNPNTQRDAQGDRHEMNTEANEYAKSGTDSTIAQHEDAAFDANTPNPEDAKAKAGKGTDVNPLDASPANVELSQKEGTKEQQGGVDKKMSEGGGGRQGGGDSTGNKYGGSSV